MIKEVKPSDVSSKDDSPPAEQQVQETEEEKYIRETEEAYHSNDEHEQFDEEFEIEW